MNVKRVLSTKNSIIFPQILSYILILLIPIIFTGIVYFVTVRTIEQETNRANLAMLKQVQLNMDNILKDAERLSFDIAFNPDIQLLANSQETNWINKQYEVSQIVKDFKRMNITNGYIDNFYVYFKNLDAVISSTAASRSNYMYPILANKDIEYEQWIDTLQNAYSGRYISIGNKADSTEDSGALAYMRSIPISNSEKPLATIVILFNKERFTEMIQNIQSAQYGSTFILDEDNGILASTASFHLSDILQVDELKSSDNMLVKGKGKESLIISYTKSDVSKLKYVSIVRREIVMEKSEFTEKLMIASIILCLIFGGAVSVLLTWRNYNPVRNLIRIVQNGKIKNSYDRSSNEYEFIYEAIQEALQEKEQINQKLKQQSSVVRADFLQKLLKGKFGNISVHHNAFYALDMQFISGDFIVVLLSIEDKGKLISLGIGDDFEAKSKLPSFVITNVFEELLGQGYKNFVTEIDEKLVFLVNLGDPESVDHVQKLVNITEELQGFFEKYYNMTLTISISDPHTGIHGMQEAYQEAAEALEYKLIAGTGKIISFQNLKNNVRDYFYPLEKEQKLVNCIKSGEFEKAKQLLDDIIRSNFMDGTPTAEMTRYFMFDLASTIVKTVKEIYAAEPVEKLFECETVAELQEEITNTLSSVCERIQSKAGNRSYELSRSIIEFVNSHYGEVTLNVAMIAENLGITPNYMSKLFKEQTGEPLPDYINKVRLEKAKVLLRDEKLNISDAAVKVGYLNSNALIRSFKKYEGVTPGKYKE
ncbi:AraC-type DNA-binding protein [Paenibacillus sp. UNCCL117]|uniref:helix-turn-helix domain-containing protein n=1 Tax=unclassified Paenibacillus TaxID=185978 RepID=UPI00087E65C8|nr:MULTISPECIES: helix-turn-helix domain-containing protein [unclassified Paenibacillus]SDB99654.1 AraC-type DNA-binding protein [Paenibacillus sp. cl123]SFW69170.1 AraC-type DNA-binding protein [Paenibacillus sp. UNCCL117]